MKKNISTKIAGAAIGIGILGSLFGGAGMATAATDGPTFAAPGVTVATGGLNSGPIASDVRTGSYGITRDSLKAVFGNGGTVTCPGSLAGTNQLDKGMPFIGSKIFGGACG